MLANGLKQVDLMCRPVCAALKWQGINSMDNFWVWYLSEDAEIVMQLQSVLGRTLFNVLCISFFELKLSFSLGYAHSRMYGLCHRRPACVLGAAVLLKAKPASCIKGHGVCCRTAHTE